RSAVRLSTLGQAQLTATLEPEDAAATTLHWQSSRASVARVSADGKVRGLLPGEAAVTVTVDGSDASVQIPVYVSADYALLVGVPAAVVVVLAALLLLRRRRRAR
ncbi:MAG: Ig-like domain-containing protein, partial [Oscillospiraceae bacterium]|nr:Ig-like domain-containing protein [Oscillospiraceae bacterium]